MPTTPEPTDLDTYDTVKAYAATLYATTGEATAYAVGWITGREGAADDFAEHIPDLDNRRAYLAGHVAAHVAVQFGRWARKYRAYPFAGTCG